MVYKATRAGAISVGGDTVMKTGGLSFTESVMRFKEGDKIETAKPEPMLAKENGWVMESGKTEKGAE